MFRALGNRSIFATGGPSVDAAYQRFPGHTFQYIVFPHGLCQTWVKYRAVSFKKDQIAALYFTMSDIVHVKNQVSQSREEVLDRTNRAEPF